jgi:hypothetical protein
MWVNRILAGTSLYLVADSLAICGSTPAAISSGPAGVGLAMGLSKYTQVASIFLLFTITNNSSNP